MSYGITYTDSRLVRHGYKQCSSGNAFKALCTDTICLYNRDTGEVIELHEHVDNVEVMVSYSSVVGFYANGTVYWCSRARGYSTTTSKQTTHWLQRLGYPSVDCGIWEFSDARHVYEYDYDRQAMVCVDYRYYNY